MAVFYDYTKHGEVSIPPLLSEQIRDARHLASRKRAADFSEPGAAKTLTALQAAKLTGTKRLLIIAPPIALRMWMRTAAAFMGTEAVYLINNSKGLKTHIMDLAKVVVTTYDLAAGSLVNAYLKNWMADFIILDEAHAIKTIVAKRTKVIYGDKAFGGPDALISGVEYVIPLTGTPILRHNDDMFTHLKALAPSLLREHNVLQHPQFITKFCYTALRSFHPRQQPKSVVINSKNTDLLSEMVYGSGFAVRRLVSDLQAMPPVTFTSVDVSFVRTPALTEATRAIQSPEMYEDEGNLPGTATVRRLLGEAKAPDVADFAMEQRELHQSPVLVLFWHKSTRDALKAALLKHGVLSERIAVIDGETSPARKAEAEDKFNNGEVDYLLGQIASMGVSLNLQRGGNIAIFAEPDWSPGSIEQAFRRLWRFGQQKHVQVYMCYADHPADNAAHKVLVNKSKNIDFFSVSSSEAARVGG